MILPSRNDIAKLVHKNPEDVIIGYASSISDLFHAGHVAYLREAKSRCDYLIVGIVDDPTIDRKWKNKPVQSLFERYIQVASCVYADCVIPLSHEQDLRDSLLLLQPDVRFVGEEYKTMSFTGDDIEEIKIIYLPRKHSFSSSDLRQRVVAAEPRKAQKPIITPEEFMDMDVCNTPFADRWKEVISQICHDEKYSGEDSAADNTTEDPYEDIGKQDY